MKKPALPSAGRLALHSKSREESAARRTQDTAALARRSGGGRGRHWLRKFSLEKFTQPMSNFTGQPALPLSLRPKDRRSTATKLV